MTTLDQLRKIAVKHILRRGPADYLLRQSLGKPWVMSTHLDEMAWTDFRSLFFNMPKLNAQLDSWGGANGAPLDPGVRTDALLAAACHEILHNLWLHKYRGKGKEHHIWSAACEYAINYELVKIFGPGWINHLGVMYPSMRLLDQVFENNLEPTTDGFYETLLTHAQYMPAAGNVKCGFCGRQHQGNDEKEKSDLDVMVRVLNQLPPDAAERSDIIRFLVAHQTAPQKVPWEMLLLGGIEDAMSQEQSWAKPSRRDEELPTWQNEKLLSFVWILDVSPSIDDEMKKSFMNTLQAGINLYNDAQHRVIFFGNGIVADITVSSGTNLSQMEIPTGSGTDLDEVWQVLDRDLPEYALVLTDLELSAVPKPQYTKVVWGIVGNYRCFDPDYGVKVVLK